MIIICRLYMCVYNVFLKSPKELTKSTITNDTTLQHYFSVQNKYIETVFTCKQPIVR